MQALFSDKSFWPKDPYNAAMNRGRQPKQEAPAFGQRLVSLRQEKGLTQYDLAERLGISRNRVVYYERRCENPSVDFVQKAAEAMNVSVEQLLDKATPITTEKPTPPRIKKLTDRLARLPRNKQSVVLEMLEGFLEKAES
ncbi:helix-turn-helix domain-containing protein [Puniceicoccaceae bacterium K14]|nr:helix-turn-helix domain-containing protein [Puniceicoccaceae bacterium K14]